MLVAAIGLAPARVLDPLTLLQDKSAQTTRLRIPSSLPVGLETATVAMS